MIESIDGDRHDETWNDSHLLQISETVSPLPDALFRLWPRASAYYDPDRKLLESFSVAQDSQASSKEATAPLPDNDQCDKVEDEDLQSEISLAELWESRSLGERFRSSKPDDIEEAEEKEILKVIRLALQPDVKLRPSAAELLKMPWFT
jgi:non-specific serine/threonine protein kinase